MLGSADPKMVGDPPSSCSSLAKTKAPGGGLRGCASKLQQLHPLRWHQKTPRTWPHVDGVGPRVVDGWPARGGLGGLCSSRGTAGGGTSPRGAIVVAAALAALGLLDGSGYGGGRAPGWCRRPPGWRSSRLLLLWGGQGRGATMRADVSTVELWDRVSSSRRRSRRTSY